MKGADDQRLDTTGTGYTLHTSRNGHEIAIGGLIEGSF